MLTYEEIDRGMADVEHDLAVGRMDAVKGERELARLQVARETLDLEHRRTQLVDAIAVARGHGLSLREIAEVARMTPEGVRRLLIRRGGDST